MACAGFLLVSDMMTVRVGNSRRGLAVARWRKGAGTIRCYYILAPQHNNISTMEFCLTNHSWW
jgi:hypothetical protein